MIEHKESIWLGDSISQEEWKTRGEGEFKFHKLYLHLFVIPLDTFLQIPLTGVLLDRGI